MESSERKSTQENNFVRKLLVIGAIVCLLLVPLGMLQVLVEERQSRQQSVADEFSKSSVASQAVSGPFLEIEYQTDPIDRPGQISVAYLKVEDLLVHGTLAPDIKRRGIFERIFYDSELIFEGQFRDDDIQVLINSRSGGEGAINLHSASIIFGLENPLGLKDVKDVSYQGVAQSAVISPNDDVVRVPLSIKELSSKRNFSFTLCLRGTGPLKIQPHAQKTKIDLNSSWPSPSFAGEFLPDSKSIETKGFHAIWSLNAVQVKFSQNPLDVPYLEVIDGFSFPGISVELIHAVDDYLTVQRATKYGLLQIVLTFLAFLVFDRVCQLRMHPIQFSMVGAAIVVFFLLLLSFSELTQFWLSYLVSAGIVTSMVSGYSFAIFRSGRKSAVIAALLSSLYWLLYNILKMEDLALISGSVVLTLALGVLMYLTSDINSDPVAEV